MQIDTQNLNTQKIFCQEIKTSIFPYKSFNHLFCYIKSDKIINEIFKTPTIN